MTSKQITARFHHILSMFLLISAAAFLHGCAKEKQATALKIGVISGPEAELMYTAATEAEKQGLQIKIIEFQDYMTPNIALVDGSIDVHAYHTRHYMENIIQARGDKLTEVGKTFIYPMAGYSKKVKDISALKEGSVIAVPNDPSNGGRALLLLQQQKIIKLKNPNSRIATPNDIKSSIKKIRVIAMDAAQLPRALQDVDIAVMNSTYALSARLDPIKHGLFSDKENGFYANTIVTLEDKRDDPRIKQLIESYQSDVVIQKAKELFGEGAVPAW